MGIASPAKFLFPYNLAGFFASAKHILKHHVGSQYAYSILIYQLKHFG